MVEFQSARRFINQFILKNFEEDITADELVNYKSILQEHTQSIYQNTPEYITIKEEGPDHLKMFTVQVFINNEYCGEGTGTSKKEAQQSAAKGCL